MSAPSIMMIVCIRSLHCRLYMYKDGKDAYVYYIGNYTAIPLSSGAFVASKILLLSLGCVSIFMDETFTRYATKYFDYFE